MSAATDDYPVYVFPEHVRRRAAMHVVSVVGPAIDEPVLRPTAGANRRPRTSAQAAPVRLTRRGVVAIGAAVAIVAGALLALAWLSAPAAAHGAPSPTLTGNTVAVRAGDSLWTIAGRAAPGSDPRAEVAVLQRLNHLDGSALVPGQVLRLH